MAPRSYLQRMLLWGSLLLLAIGFSLSGAASSRTDDLSRLALTLAIVISAAKLGGEAAGRFGQPVVLGELLAGVLLGNLPGLERLQILGSDVYLDALAQLGMLLLLFEVGLELSV